MIDGAPGKIIWCYGMYQPAYDEMLKTIANIMFVEGVPGDLETLIIPSMRNLVVIQDLMHESCTSRPSVLDAECQLKTVRSSGMHRSKVSRFGLF